MLRKYDKALAEFLVVDMPVADEFGNITTEEIPMTMATPRRQFEAGTNMTMTGEFEPTAMEIIKIPSTTLTRLDAIFDYRRFTVAEWRNLKYSRDLNEVMTSRFPLPYNLMYQFEAWADKMHDINRIHEEYLLKFVKPVWVIDVDFPDPWGTHPVSIMEDSINNMSIFEPGEDERYLRFASTITMEAWLPLPVAWKRTVQKYGIDVILESTGDVIASLETEYADKQEFWDSGDKEQVLEWV